MKTNKKKVLLLSLATVICLTIAYFGIMSAKTSGWLLKDYGGLSILEKLIISSGIMLVVSLVLSFIVSMYYIVKGKTKENEDGTKIENPVRRVGLALLIWTLSTIFFLYELLTGHLTSVEYALLFISCLLIITVCVIITSIRHKTKKAMIPLFLSIALLLVNIYFGILTPFAYIGAPHSRGSTGGLNSSVKNLGGMAFDNFSSVGALSSSSSAGGLKTKMSATSGMSNSLGFAVGGAKDINNFRDNIKNNYLPLPTDITYEGLFYDYYFDTGMTKESDKLFSPSYTSAITKDPISGNNDYYLSVGLNSNIKAEDFKRKKLNLVVVLDISGSMNETFNSYYYDNKNKSNNSELNNSKIQVATKSIGSLLNHLNGDDRFGMVVFDDQGAVAKELGKIKDCDMAELKNDILSIKTNGSTNIEDGYQKAADLFKKLSEQNDSEYENRIILLTDAMPNTGDISQDSLANKFKTNAENKIYSTFIGIGVDFNSELVEAITKTRGANYYKVSSTEEFKNRMDKEFDFMVTPLVFNLELKLDAKGYSIENVYGSPEANLATGEIMKVNTLFPSATSDEGTKGGVILLKLKKLTDDSSLNISVSYEDRDGKKDQSTENIVLTNDTNEYFANNGIRKAVLLARYADLLKNWSIDERQNYSNWIVQKTLVSEESGIVVPPTKPMLGQWERESLGLKVSNKYKDMFKQFSTYFEQEAKVIGDKTLNQESEILKTLAK